LDHKKKVILKEIADHHQASIFQILLAWTIRDGNTISITKSGNLQHMKENADSVNITLNESELPKIDSVFSKPQSKERLALW
jgi:diketogulonate reductase-like aldo/keto reductase